MTGAQSEGSAVRAWSAKYSCDVSFLPWASRNMWHTAKLNSFVSGKQTQSNKYIHECVKKKNWLQDYSYEKDYL